MSEVVGRGQEIAAITRWFASDGPPPLVIEGEAGLGDPPPRGRRAGRLAGRDRRLHEERAIHAGRAAEGPDAAAAGLVESAAREARARGVRNLSATP